MKKINLILLLAVLMLAGLPSSSSAETKKTSKTWLRKELTVENGYRVDDFHFNFAGDSNGQNPNIASELSWQGLDIYELKVTGKAIANDLYVLKSSFGYGWIENGRMRDSDYLSDNRNGEFSRSDNDSNGDSVLDASLALGRQFKPTPKLKITPLLGYSYNEQHLRITNGFQTIPATGAVSGLNSTYETKWYGPWIGADFAYKLGRGWALSSSLQYHVADYHAVDNHNLRRDLAHEKSFRADATAEGIGTSFGLSYDYSKNWSINLMLELNYWKTNHGVERAFPGNGSELDSRYNEAVWGSSAVFLGMTYRFDPAPDPLDEESILEKKNPYKISIKMSGHYRLAAGAGQDFILNDSNADLQERNFRYIFGERLNNTFDPAVYDQYLLNLDVKPHEKFNFYTQIVADPWSWVGTTGEQVQRSDLGGEVIRYNLKYFGANNSMINEIWRTNVTDSIAFPVIKVHDGHTAKTVVHGFFDYNPATNGVPFTIPELAVDYEFKPIRKLWMDVTEDRWHFRAFALADQTQVLTTDDPIGLSDHKDYWQQSPWLYEYKPIQFFEDRSIQRGYYSDTISFLARDSEGNRLVLLRGASVEADLGRTYFAGTVAAPYSPWDKDYFTANNFPGAFRLKHQTTDKLMVGGTYTFRTGLIDRSVADWYQGLGVDAKYALNKNTTLKAEIAGTHRERDLLTNVRVKTDSEGYAYKAVVDSKFDHKWDGSTEWQLSYTQMDIDFDPLLSRFTNTRDDHFWGKHLTFSDYTPNLEYFRIGDGVDTNRMVVRARWKEKLFKDKFVNLIDLRNVHKTSNTAYKETVLREEATVQINQQLTAKGLFRWQGLPKSTPYIEPFTSNFYVVDVRDPVFQNAAVEADKDSSRFTYSGGLQYILNKKWAAEAFVERSNDVSDFPRGLLNNTFRDANDRVDGLLIDHVTNFLYSQGPLGGAPPYKYFTIFRERLIYKPQEQLTFTFHAAQNSYKFAGGIDDNINHQGLSVAFNPNQKITLFMDYTHSMQIDLPKLIATSLRVSDFEDHHNFYTSMDYKLNASQLLRAEYGVFGMGLGTPLVTPYSTSTFSLPTIDTEHLLRVSLTGDF